MACLGHADAWPTGDLALQEAVRLAFALPARPSAKEMLALAETWRPMRAIAARVLWTYYLAFKGRDGAPVPASRLANSSPNSRRSKQAGSKQNRSKRGRNGRRT